MECEIPMSSIDFLKKIKEEIISSLPSDAQITNVEFEGPEIAVYSKNVDLIGEENQAIKEVAKQMRKRIVIRSDESIRVETKAAMEMIQAIVPAEAEITNIFFDENLGEVIIEAKITEDDGTARDKVTRIQHLGELSLAGRSEDNPKYEVIACIGGRGFGVRREDMKKMILATRGKVFTSKTLDRLVECTRLKEFKTR